MLCISMKIGQYFTVDDQTVIQFDRMSGERIHLAIKAPRDVSILRGEVLERNGGERPACVVENPAPVNRQFPWSAAKRKALLEMRETLAQMGDTPETRQLREQLDRIFPQPESAAKAVVI